MFPLSDANLFSILVFQYRCYKKFDNLSFRSELRDKLSIIRTYDEFNDVYLHVLNKHAPLKFKTVRANNAPYLTPA